MNIHSFAMTTSAKAPSRPSQRVIGTDKRDAITRAALELFVERGFHGVAVPEIADRANVGAGTIYRYFESKEALVNVLYREEKARFAQDVIESFPVASGARDLFRALWMRMAAYATKNEASFVFLELHHHAPYLDDESRAVETRMLAMFEAIISSAQARGELKQAPPRLLMGLVMGAFIGVIRSCVEMDQTAATADWKLAEQCMWEAIRA
jgi:TetR/AcrR family transcriptional regulator, repressor of fatR-cypB operon